MKNRKLAFLMILFTLVFSVNKHYSQSKVEKDKLNIMDYYSLFLTERADSDPNLAIKDLENNYLMFSFSSGRDREVSLFRGKDEKPILVVIDYSCSLSTCEDLIDAYEPILEKLKPVAMQRVTDEVLPRLSERENRRIFKSKRIDNGKEPKEIRIDYRLYETGNTIQVFAGAKGEKYIKLYEMHLTKDKFVIIRN